MTKRAVFRLGEPVSIDTLIIQRARTEFEYEYRSYLICNNGTTFGFRHKDFDGIGDNRYGHADNYAKAKEMIDDQIFGV